jgi:hypothetical protein
MSYRVTEQELKDFTKAMNEWQEKQNKKKERFKNNFLYKIYSSIMRKGDKNVTLY